MNSGGAKENAGLIALNPSSTSKV